MAKVKATCAECGFPVDRLIHILGCTNTQRFDVRAVVDELVRHIRHALDYGARWNKEGYYTFPDGSTYYRRDRP